MAIQFTDFSKARIMPSPYDNFLENALKGYQISKEPAKMKEEQSARELANQLKTLEVEHKPKEYELNDQGKSLANALHSKALEHYEEKFGLDRDLKEATIKKLTQQANPLELAAAKKQQEFNIKRADEIEKLIPHLLETAQDVAGIQSLMTDDKSPTGLLKGALNKVGLGSEALGEFNEKALRLQADLARLISSRGGAVAAGLAATGKPSAYSSKEYNLGITKSMQNRIQREFNQLKKEYEKKTGRELPYTLEGIFQGAIEKSAKQNKAPEIINVSGGIATVSHKGKTFRIPEKLLDQYMMEHTQAQFGE